MRTAHKTANKVVGAFLLGLLAGCSGQTLCDGTDPSCGSGSASATQSPQKLRRLTRAEYDSTITDLFGIPSTWGAAMVPENVVLGFHNQADALTVTPLLVNQLQQASEDIAAAAVKDLGRLAPCAAAAAPGADCAATVISGLGMRAFRRPLTAAEQAQYLQLYNATAADGFADGVQAVISALLQSPKFLYRTEIGRNTGGGHYELTAYEIATELSYFLWGTMPDAELFSLAQSGALKDGKTISAQAQRMWKDQRARGMLRRFIGQWLNLDQLATVPKDATSFPEFTPAIRGAMLEEAARYVSYVAFDGAGTYKELLQGGYSFRNHDLAQFYGGTAPQQVDASGYGQVDLTGQPAGLLTLGAVLNANGRPDGTAPVQRGKLIRQQVLCQQLPPPPPNVNTTPPAPSATMTARQRYGAHETNPACSGCHRLMDQIGLGLEDFDGVGRYRALENGMPLDLSGQLLSVDVDPPAFNGPQQLEQMLAGSGDAQRCFATQWLRYAYGVNESAGLTATLKGVADQFVAGGQRIPDLLVALTQTDYFRVRSGDPAGTGLDDGTGAPAPGGGTPTPPPPPTPPATMLTVDRTNQSTWGTGYCDNVTVTNQGTGVVSWQITLSVKGTINNSWNTTVTTLSGGQVQFAGVTWNAQLQPGGSAAFGFCAQL